MVSSTKREFIRRRFHIVKQQLDDPAAEIDRVDRIQLQREHRLLGKLLDEAPEGQVRSTLIAWRNYLGGQFARHKESTRAQQDAYDRWWRQPNDERDWKEKPEPPSLGLRIIAKSGHKWVIDDRFLLMVDDLLQRLEKWMSFDEQ